MTADFLGVLNALIAAVLAGGADFSGGFATRRHNQFQVLWLSSLVGIVVLAVFALLWGDTLPSTRSIFFAALGGALGAIGIAVLYNALAVGRVAVASPASAVVGAAVPVLFAALVEGLPGAVTLAGFVLAAAGIWLTTRTEIPAGNPSENGLLQGVLSGLAFGGFFILIAQIEAGPVFAALVFGKISAAAVGLLFLLLKRIPVPAFRHNPVAALAGVLDAATNVFYLSAAKLVRVDIAAMLLCTYPAVTVLLAMIIFKEKVSRAQMAGVIMCLLAIGLIVV